VRGLGVDLIVAGEVGIISDIITELGRDGVGHHALA